MFHEVILHRYSSEWFIINHLSECERQLRWWCWSMLDWGGSDAKGESRCSNLNTLQPPPILNPHTTPSLKYWSRFGTGSGSGGLVSVKHHVPWDHRCSFWFWSDSDNSNHFPTGKNMLFDTTCFVLQHQSLKEPTWVRSWTISCTDCGALRNVLNTIWEEDIQYTIMPFGNQYTRSSSTLTIAISYIQYLQQFKETCNMLVTSWTSTKHDTSLMAEYTVTRHPPPRATSNYLHQR